MPDKNLASPGPMAGKSKAADTTNETTPSPDVTHKATTGDTTEEQDARDKLQASAGEHDYSDAANKGQNDGSTVLDTYAKGTLEHPNRAGEAPRLVPGQAPSAPARPMVGSENAAGALDKAEDDPTGGVNAINKSPVLRGPKDEDEEAK